MSFSSVFCFSMYWYLTLSELSLSMACFCITGKWHLEDVNATPFQGNKLDLVYPSCLLQLYQTHICSFGGRFLSNKMPMLSVSKTAFNFPFLSAAASPRLPKWAAALEKCERGAWRQRYPRPPLVLSRAEGLLGPSGGVEGVLHTTAESCCVPP